MTTTDPARKPPSAAEIHPITDANITPTTFPALFSTAASAFGAQTHDAVFELFNPSWSTPSGATLGASRLETRWRKGSLDKEGRPCTIYLEATIPDPTNPQGGMRKTVGLAIWVQASFVPGWGEDPGPEALAELNLNGQRGEPEPDWEAHAHKLHLEQIHPHDAGTQRYITQCDASLHSDRWRALKEIADAGGRQPPAAFVLDMCAVTPEAQGKGVASALVRWGLEEAERRGGLECMTEGSMMGRGVYEKLGFRRVKQVEWRVDEEWRGLERPDNVFMRTGWKGDGR